MERNSFASINKEPVTEKDLLALRARTNRLWEDTQLVTTPNGISIRLTIGQLQAIIDTALIEVRSQKLGGRLV